MSFFSFIHVSFGNYTIILISFHKTSYTLVANNGNKDHVHPRGPWQLYLDFFVFLWFFSFFKNQFSQTIPQSVISPQKPRALGGGVYCSHYLPLCEKSNFWKNRDFPEFWWFFDKSKFGRLAGRKWPESWLMFKNVFFRHFKSIFT